MNEDILRLVLPYLKEKERKSFAYTDQYYFACIYKTEFRKIVLSKQNNLIYYLIYQDFRDRVERLIRSPMKQLSFHSFDEKQQTSSRVIQAVIHAVHENRYLPYAWEGFGLSPPSLPLTSYDLALPVAGTLRFHSVVTTDLIFHRYLQPAIKSVTYLSIRSDYSSDRCFLAEIFSFLKEEGESLGLKSLTVIGFNGTISTLPYISTLEQLEIRQSSVTLDSKYEKYSHQLNSITSELNKAWRKFNLRNVRTVRFHHSDIEDIRDILRVEEIFLSFCTKLQHFPPVFPPSEQMFVSGYDILIDVTDTRSMSLLWSSMERLDSFFLPENPKELRQLSLTAHSSVGNPESLSFSGNGIACVQRDGSRYEKVLRSQRISINRFQLASIVRIPSDQRVDDRRYLHVFSPEGNSHFDSFRDRSDVSINILFRKLSR